MINEKRREGACAVEVVSDAFVDASGADRVWVVRRGLVGKPCEWESQKEPMAQLGASMLPPAVGRSRK